MSHTALSQKDANAALDLIDNTLCCMDVKQFNHLVDKLKFLIGFDHAQCVCGDFSKYSEKRADAFTGACFFPSEWADHYLEKDYILIDPIVKQCLAKPGIQYWADAFKSYETESSIKLDHEAKSFGLKDGWMCTIPLDRSFRLANISLAGEFVSKDSRSKVILDYVLPHMAEALRRVCLNINEPLPKLTPREMETLFWSAEGKTAWEISVILSISERTVQFHINNIVAKLNASNSRHAVAIALSRGILKF